VFIGLLILYLYIVNKDEYITIRYVYRHHEGEFCEFILQLHKVVPKIFHWVKTEGPKIEVELPKAESGGRVLGERAASPYPTS